MSEDNIVTVESAQEWADAAAPPPETGPLTIEQATQDLRDKREKPKPVEYKTKDNKPVNLRTAAKDYTFTKKLHAGKQLLEQGMAPEQALETLEQPEPLPRKVGDRILGDHEKIGPDDAVTAAEAARDLSAWRERLAAEEQAALEALTSEAPEPTAPKAEPPSPDEAQQRLAAERARIEHERRGVEYLKRMNAAEVGAHTQLQQLAAMARAEFPDATTVEGIKKIAAENPKRFQRLLQLDQALIQTQQRAMALGQQRQVQETAAAQRNEAIYAQQRRAYGEQQDRELDERLKKEMPNVNQKDLQRAVRKTLNSMGVPDEQIGAHYHRGVPVDMRSATVQMILAKAALWDQATEKAKSVRAKLLPPVQPPGAHYAASNGAANEISSLKSQLKTAKGHRAIRLAADLVAAERRARS